VPKLRQKATILLGDLILIGLVVVGMTLVLGIRHPTGPLLVAALLPPAFYLTGLYELDRGGFLSRPLLQAFVACALTGIAVATIGYLTAPPEISRRLLVGSLLLIALLLGPWRLALQRMARRSPSSRVPVVVMGRGMGARDLQEILSTHPHYELRGVSDDPFQGDGLERTILPLVREANGAGALFRAAPPTVVVLNSHELEAERHTALLSLRTRGVRVCDLPTFWEEVHGRLPVSHLTDEWLALHSSIRPDPGGLTGRTKRALDVVGSLLLVSVLAVPATVAAIALWLNDPGPILFRQRRTGRAERPFTIFKLRTMVRDAAERGPPWTLPGDPRVTTLGRWIRKTRLDEVPQLVNVLKGDMSLVGPRPEAVELTARYAEEIRHYALRHLVKPGVTGWAQIHFPNTASVEDAVTKLEYDLYYVHRMNLVLDLRILLKTVYVVLSGRE